MSSSYRDRTEHGTWQFGCGAPLADGSRCPNAWYLKNQVLVCPSTERCDNCKDFGPGDPMDLDDINVPAELGWCGCGHPDLVDDLMLAFLTGVETRWAVCHAAPAGHDCGTNEVTFPYGMNYDVATLLAYIADEIGWTEHGGAVGGEWLTPDGEETLANLRARLVLVMDYFEDGEWKRCSKRKFWHE
jgi:hypothetical protein